MTIRAKPDGEVTQGLMERWPSGDGGYRVSLYCKAKELQACRNGLYTGALLGYNKETIIEGIEGREGNKAKTCRWLCHLQIGDVIKWKRKQRKAMTCLDLLWEVLWPSIVTDCQGGSRWPAAITIAWPSYAHWQPPIGLHITSLRYHPSCPPPMIIPGLWTVGEGLDGSYKKKGQGVSTFVAQLDNMVMYMHNRLVSSHSSYDAEMKAANMAIEYLVEHTVGKVLVFIDNQSTLKSLFNVKPHLLFELSRCNSIELGRWISGLPQNEVEFHWMPSHIGFYVNELADKAADLPPIRPYPVPHMTIASHIRDNKAAVVKEWHQAWRSFSDTKDLCLKKK